MAETRRTLLERIDINLLSTLSVVRSCARRIEDLLALGAEIKQLVNDTKAGIIMANEQVEALIAQFNQATNDIAARLATLAARLAGTVTPEEIAELTAIKDRLAALGADPSDPIPVA